MPKKLLPFSFGILGFFWGLIFFPSPLFAQVTDEEKQELKESRYENIKDREEKPKTADEIMSILKERAMLKIKENANSFY